jgi:ubiquitin carboxyl-terminal hydrolase 5/13
LNFTLSKIIEEGKELIPMFGAGYTGLDNLGNSCYMNSVIQLLFTQPEFKDKYLSSAQLHLMTCGKFAPECLECQISKLVDGIFSGRYSEKKIAKKVEYEG